MMIQYHIITTLTMLVLVARAFSPMALSARRSFNRPAFFPSCKKTICCTVFNQHNHSKSNNQQRRKQTTLFSTSNHQSTVESTSKIDEEPKRPPITILAGFLGSGKTTTLQNLLNNREGIKIGIIVNDVASVNIDSKLLSNPNSNKLIGSEETIELQNGCACCSLADELLTTIDQLTNSGQRDLDHIVIELSGVADPEAMKKNWMSAERMGHPATKFAKFDKVVTLIDSSTFGTDWMTWDTSYDRDGWVDFATDPGEEKMVPELLSEQIEAADVLVLNKIDLAGEEQTKVASNLAQNMNDKATIFEVNYGNIPIREVIDASPLLENDDKQSSGNTDNEYCSHSHSHEHAAHDNESSDDSSAHSHDHDHGECKDDSHSHSHEHSSHDNDSHSHSHDHNCSDPDCDDPTHDHSHTHDHSTSVDNLGITNFVYKRDRPFHTMRLLNVLNQWPVPVKDELDLDLLKEAANEGVNLDGRHEKSPFVGVLRSKGFCWMAPTQWDQDGWRHDTAMYWSHAGKHFGLSNAGQWWGILPSDQMKAIFFQNEKEYERIIREDFITEEFKDRRQEIVFIGANISESYITKTLDECLYTEEEMESYRKEVEAMSSKNRR